MAIPSDITTFDPRQARELTSTNLLHLVYSGLTRLAADGNIYPELAQSIECSEDGVLYQIILRDALWSDGSPVTAEDFVYSWTSMLNKGHAFPNAHFLFWLRNGKDVYNGIQSSERLGVRAKGDRLLEVELEQPCPFFKELLSTLPYVAIPKKYALQGGTFKAANPAPSSGPYMFLEWIPQSSIGLVKNEKYFGASHVKYECLDFPIVEDTTAVSMIERHELEWAGSPLGTLPIDVIHYLKGKNKLCTAPALGTFFLRVNCLQSPLTDVRIRKALSLCIDRKALVEHVLQGGQIPAYGLVPPIMLKQNPSADSPVEDPKSLLSDYCTETNTSPESIHLALLFGAGERSLKIAQVLQQDFKKHLGIDVELHPCETKQFFSKISHLDYDIALSNWLPDYPDPHAFYSVFENAENGTNNTGWESHVYQSLLCTSNEATDAAKRKELFLKMEQLLARELPIIPLFHASFTYINEGSSDGIRVSPFGYIDPIQP